MPPSPKGWTRASCGDLPLRHGPKAEPAGDVLFSGPASQAALQARQLLADQHDVAAELWSVTSYKPCARRPSRSSATTACIFRGAPGPYVSEALANAEGP